MRSLIISFLVCLVILGHVLPSPGEDRLTLQGHVAVEQELPPEMYGSWQRNRFLIASSFPETFVPFESGYWVIEKHGSQLTLSNPDKNTRATLRVEEVTGNTARFEYHSTLENGTPCREELTLTASESGLLGLQKKECFPDHSAPYSAFAKVEATRLNGNISWFW